MGLELTSGSWVGKESHLQPPPCPPFFPRLVGTFLMRLEALKVSKKSTYCCQAPAWVCAPVGSADAGAASPCPSLAAPRTCSPLLPTPQLLPGTQDFVFVDLFASSPAGSGGHREAVQPGASGLRIPGSSFPAHKGPSRHGPATWRQVRCLLGGGTWAETPLPLLFLP